MNIPSLNHMLLAAVDRYQKPDAFRFKQDGTYTDVSHADFAAGVERTSLGLQTLGVTPGDRVALMAENRLEWALLDYAILCARAVNVPIYPTLLPHQIEYLLGNSGTHVVCVSTAEQAAKIEQVRANLPELQHVIIIEPHPVDGLPPASGGQEFHSLETLQHRGKEESRADPERFRAAATQAERDDLATIIYTSGTTGLPKGVKLTHGNLITNIQALEDILDLGPADSCLSFLPLSHVFERTCGHFLMMHKGVTIAYAESVETVQPNLVEVRPTLMVSVPRLYEKIHARVKTMVAGSPPLRQKIFHWALATGWQAAQQRMQGKRVGGPLAFKVAIADRLVFRKLRARTGGRVRFFFSGGAPLSADVGQFFFSAGFTIYEGYGLTETSPVLTVNRPDLIKLGMVGAAVSGVEIKIAEDGEILARGPSIMPGYYKNEAATAEAIDADGWFHTGDIGMLDADGCLAITDRKKDLLVTAGGKNIAPQPIENRLKTSRFITESVLIGDRRKYPVVLIVPDFEALAGHAREIGVETTSTTELCRHPQIVEFMLGKVESLCGNLAHFERPKRIALIDQEFTIESGELTPSLKVKRKVVIEKFKDLIDTLYVD